MRCPLCVDEVLDAHHRHGIEIDMCPRCRGIWLDRGELDKLLDDAGERAPEPTPRPRDGNDRDGNDRDERRRDDRERDERERRERERRDDDRKKKRKKKKSGVAKLADLLDDVLDL